MDGLGLGTRDRRNHLHQAHDDHVEKTRRRGSSSSKQQRRTINEWQPVSNSRTLEQQRARARAKGLKASERKATPCTLVHQLVVS
ncbi:hypothetical protein XA68_18438 [Ophiocordyceps unilateralis]|uniref:Uncharacterized protein n=1 Tax=Ophiocordyceps unilateralis TaxID=268505 RepID=A0A2A9P149_OPHUN|nr:hypothetical protein XA68_18438 [Ophiocordyceps unilateralis]